MLNTMNGRAAQRLRWGHSHGTRNVSSSAAQVHAARSVTDRTSELAQLVGEQLSWTICAPTPLGRGIVMQKRAQANQAIISVPIQNAMILSDEPLESISIFGDRAQRAWQQQHGALPEALLDFLSGEERWDVRMTGWLLHVLTSEMPAGPSRDLWKLYISLLPTEQDCSCLLSYADGPERTELQLPRIIQEAKAQHEWVVYVHDHYFSKAKGKAAAALRTAQSLEQTLWASAMVRSRTFSDTISGEGLTLMVPFADLANHSFDHNATFCMGKDRESFEIRSVEEIHEGQEAVISYGENKSNPELMRDYGFVVPGNPNDRIPLPGMCLFEPDQPAVRKEAAAAKGKAKEGSSTSSSSNAGSGGSSTATAPALPLLNGASLMEAAGMRGQWMKGELEAQATFTPAADNVAVAAVRRRSALLSLRLSDGYGLVGGAAKPDETAQGRGMFGGWGKSWTESGTPDPRTIQGSEIQGERQAVATYSDYLRSLISPLPTSIEEDRQLLAAAGQQQVGVPAMSPRTAAAVRCRLEWKAVVKEGLHALNAYAQHLESSTLLRGRRV